MLVNISVKFYEDILSGLKVTEMTQFVTETATYKVQRAITLNIYIYISKSYGSCALHVT